MENKILILSFLLGLTGAGIVVFYAYYLGIIHGNEVNHHYPALLPYDKYYMPMQDPQTNLGENQILIGGSGGQPEVMQVHNN